MKLFLVIYLIVIGNAIAVADELKQSDPYSQSSTIESTNDKAETYRLWSQKQPNGRVELVMANVKHSPFDVKQITYSNDETISKRITPIALQQGGQWGWHVFWNESVAHNKESEKLSGFFYGRIDGESWVSSPPKRLSNYSPINPKFSLDNQKIIVTWQQENRDFTANMQAVSQDEGRTWEVTAVHP
jgi:hypothetical protein